MIINEAARNVNSQNHCASTMNHVTVVVILTTVFALYWWLKIKYSYWKLKGVSSVPVIPFLGNQLEFITVRKSMALINANIYERYKNEKIVGTYKGVRPELHIFDPDLIRMVLVKDFNHFSDRSVATSDKDILTQHLFRLRGEKWRLLRQKISPTFTSAKMREMFPLILECGEQLQNYLESAIKDGDVTEIREVMAKFTTDIIGTCAFGIQMNSMSDENAVFRKVGQQFTEPSVLRAVFASLYGMMPSVIEFLRLTSLTSASKQIQDFFLNLTKRIIDERLKSPSKRHDFIELMLELRAKSESDSKIHDKLKLTDELITAQSFIFFLAGFETSSTTMSYALLELARNTDIQDKLFNEIERVTNTHNGNVTYEALQEMTFLSKVLDETLRKYPIVSFLDRVCVKKYHIPDTDIVIDKGVDIIIPVYSIQNDPQHFPQPDQFLPERFSKDLGEKTFHPFSYLPFGEGPRNCIGMRFGKLQASVGLIYVLRKFSVHVCDKTPTRFDFDKTFFLLVPTCGIYLRLKLRK